VIGIFTFIYLMLIKRLSFLIFILLKYILLYLGGARWPRGQCARRAIAKAKERPQRSVIGLVTKICNLELLRASKGTLSRMKLISDFKKTFLTNHFRLDLKPRLLGHSCLVGSLFQNSYSSIFITYS
jgi:hypothetical protein